MGKQCSPRQCLGGILCWREYDMVVNRIRARTDFVRRRRGNGICVYSNVAEVFPEASCHKFPRGGIKRLPAAALQYLIDNGRHAISGVRLTAFARIQQLTNRPITYCAL